MLTAIGLPGGGRRSGLAARLAFLAAAFAAGCGSEGNRNAQDPPRSVRESAAPPAVPAPVPPAAPSAAAPALEDLQGAWWSDSGNPTADFGIQGDRVWLDAESGLNPCRIVGDTLVFDMDGGARQVKNRILRLAGDTLLLENAVTGEPWEVVRAGN